MEAANLFYFLLLSRNESFEKAPGKIRFRSQSEKNCTMMAAMILSVTLIAVIKVIKVGFLVAGPNEFKQSLT